MPLPDLLIEAYRVGYQHGEYFSRILETTEPSRRDALREGALIRCRRFVVDNLLSVDRETLAHAENGFDDAINSTEKEHNDV